MKGLFQCPPWARSFWAFSPYLNHMRNFSKISKYACESTKIISKKGKIFSKCLRNMQIIEYFSILFLSLIIIKYERKKVILEIFK